MSDELVPQPRNNPNTPPVPPEGHIDVHPGRSPFVTIMARAREPRQGRETPDGVILDNLSWQEGDLNKSVTDHIKVEHEREEVLERKMTKHPVKGFGPFGEPKKTRTIHTEKWLHVVKTQNAAGQVTSVEHLTDDELGQGFHKASSGDGPGVSNVRLPAYERRLQPTDDDYKYVSLPVALQDDDDVLRAVNEQRWAYRLPNLVGLTWNDGEGYRQVADDNAVEATTEDTNTLPAQLLTVYSVDALGRINRVDLVDRLTLESELKALAKKTRYMHGAPSAASRHLRFEVTPEQAALARRSRAVGRAALNADPADQDTNTMSRPEAMKLLGFHDVLGDEYYDLARKHLPKAEVYEDILKLRRMVAEVGKNKVLALATSLQKTYLADARSLGLLQNSGAAPAQSISWSLLELARLYHFAKTDPRGAPPLIAGKVGVVDPFIDSERGRYKLREIVDRRIGRRLGPMLLKPVSQPEVIRAYEVDGEIKKETKLRTRYVIDTEFVKSLEPSTVKALGLAPLPKNVRKVGEGGIISQVARGKRGPLDWPDWIDLGRTVRESLGH